MPRNSQKNVSCSKFFSLLVFKGKVNAPAERIKKKQFPLGSELPHSNLTKKIVSIDQFKGKFSHGDNKKIFTFHQSFDI
jgi:hypothetical protein